MEIYVSNKWTCYGTMTHRLEHSDGKLMKFIETNHLEEIITIVGIEPGSRSVKLDGCDVEINYEREIFKKLFEQN